jgi:adenine-specific DNA-methyltransferase
VLDCFAGTGTMGEAVLRGNAEEKIGARMVLIQLPEIVAGGPHTFSELAIKRVTKSLESLEAKLEPGSGLRCFQLDRSAFAAAKLRTDSTASELRNALASVASRDFESRGADDLAFEVLCSAGFKLTQRLKYVDVAGAQFTVVDAGTLMINLEPTLPRKVLNGLTDPLPQRIVVLDDIFADSDADRITAALSLRARGVELKTV